MNSNVIINFNEQYYLATYNKQSGYYELELVAPSTGGIYNTDITFTNFIGEKYEDTKKVQIWAKEQIKIETNKVFMWIFDYTDFSVKNIVEISDYEINIDEETNANTLINILKSNSTKSQDIIAIKKNNVVVYWGTIKDIQNENGKQVYKNTIRYITNIFNQKIKLEKENLIKEKGIEDFIAEAIKDNFISNIDAFVNKKYLEVIVKTHTKKQISVSNVNNGIYNLHTWMTNCTQNYDIVYDFFIVNRKLVMTIENKSYDKELIDTQAQAISNYTEVFKTDIVSKVEVLTSTNTYTLYLLNDRTTTTDMNDINRAEGKVETVFTEKYEDAVQKALDTMKSNSYNHNITFNLYDKYIKVGTPIAIKTKESIILDTYISAIKITPGKFYKYTCGNIRIDFIDKLLKERNR
ncbi:MAG: hypothetical protein HFJ47_00160 [Clostridia bacterium]|nr:hypothetical protein [Clostridia bacterium]